MVSKVTQALSQFFYTLSEGAPPSSSLAALEVVVTALLLLINVTMACFLGKCLRMGWVRVKCVSVLCVLCFVVL